MILSEKLRRDCENPEGDHNSLGFGSVNPKAGLV